MYVCTYVRMCVCMYVCVYLCVYVYVYIIIYIYDLYMNIYIYIAYIFIHICIYMHMYIYIYMYMLPLYTYIQNLFFGCSTKDSSFLMIIYIYPKSVLFTMLDNSSWKDFNPVDHLTLSNLPHPFSTLFSQVLHPSMPCNTS